MTQRDTLEELDLLLPFYVNGTLSAADKLIVDDALVGAPHLRTSIEQQVQLSQRIKAAGESWLETGTSLDDQLVVVFSKIDDAVVQAPVQAMSPKAAPARASFKELLGFLSPNNWHPAVSLALALAVLAQGAILLGWNNDRQAQGTTIASLEKRLNDLEFQLASGPDGPMAQGNVILQLDKNTSWSAVEALLSAQDLSIVGGPNDGTLTLSTPAEGAALDEIITKLRASPLVASADKAA